MKISVRVVSIYIGAVSMGALPFQDRALFDKGRCIWYNEPATIQVGRGL